MMRAIQVHKFGGPQVLQVATNVPIPKVEPGKVLVHVKAAGVNPVDTYIREGSFGYSYSAPYTPGKDGAGLVEEVGEGVTSVKRGDRVFFSNRNRNNVHGSYAQYSLLDDVDVWPLPERVSFEKGAALGIPYFTAYRAIVLKAKTQASHHLLVHGASGGVGTACIQIAKHLVGAKVAGTAGTPYGLDLVRSLGADFAACHRQRGYLPKITEWTEGHGVNVIIEMLANVNLEHDLTLLGQNGVVVVVGNRGSIEIDPRHMMGRETSIIGTALFSSTPEEWQATAKAIVQGLEAGWLDPVMDRTYPLAEAKAAHHDIMHSKGAKGNMVINPDL
ncbi:quinone oxidoreductase-like [Amblyomma americanum]|uniref:Enoyl reductase (ER) domain-containing protein n=1 Tax=Amblyomma americanum TaxID=6943 RepID=A0AAQ4EKS7_AMBAM